MTGFMFRVMKFSILVPDWEIKRFVIRTNSKNLRSLCVF